MNIREEVLRQYAGMGYHDLLRRILWEKNALLTGQLDSYNRPIDVVNEYHGGAVFTKRYGISLTVGDITALQTDLEGHADLLWKRIQGGAK